MGTRKPASRIADCTTVRAPSHKPGEKELGGLFVGFMKLARSVKFTSTQWR
jgi:hypothetical protein